MAPLSRRLCSLSHTAVWDFLAPTTTKSALTSNLNRSISNQQCSSFSTSSLLSAAQPATGSTRTPSQAGSKRHQQPRKAQQTKQKQQHKPDAAAPSKRQPKVTNRKPARVHAPPASSIELLSSIRGYTPPTKQQTQPPQPATPTAPSNAFNNFVDPSQAHNQAVMNLLSGAASGQFSLCFTAGWSPLRQAGQIGRLKTADLVRVLESASNAMARGEKAARWEEVRELVLWVCGERGMPWIDRWAMREVERGVEGCERVVQIWEDLLVGEHLKLRQGEDALDAGYKDPLALAREESEDATATDSTNKPLVSFRTYGIVIIARSILNNQIPEATRPTLRSLLPELVHPRAPMLRTLVPHALPQLSADKYADPAGTLARGESWIRQVALAQRWWIAAGGLDILRQFNADLRKGRTAEAWETWLAVQDAVASEEYGWLANRWKESEGKKWVDSREAEAELAGAPEVEPVSRETVAIASEDDTLADSPAEPSPLDEAKLRAPRPPFNPVDAHLTQAFVAPFLAGFAKLKMFTEANAIWLWLQDKSLTPGVVVWTGLIAGYASRGDVQAVETTWKQMLELGIRPDAWAYLEHARAYFEAKRPDDATRIADALLADKRALALLGGNIPPLIYSTLIGGLLSNGRHEQARAIMTQMGDEVSVHVVNLFLREYTRGKKPDFAKIVECLRIISEHQLEPDVITFTMVLQALLTMGQQDAPTKLVKIMEDMGVKPTVTTYGAIIHSLARTGVPEQLAAAVEVLNEMERAGEHTNEIIYTSLIQGFLRAISNDPGAVDQRGQHPYFNAALALKARMDKRGLRLNRVGYNAIIASGLQLRSDWGTELAMQAFRDLRKLKANFKSSNYEITREGEVVTPADTWYVLLSGFAQHGDWSRAREVVAEMNRDRFDVRSNKLQRLVDVVMRGGWVR